MARKVALSARLLSCFLGMALLAGCSQASVAAPSQTPSFTPVSSPSGISVDQASAYANVQRELTDFLEVWRTKGSAEAARAYLGPDLHVTSADDALSLTSGRVVTVRPDTWTSAGLFVVYADFDLQFAGNFGAWGNGRSSRFVTATARAGTIPYVLEFATSR